MGEYGSEARWECGSCSHSSVDCFISSLTPLRRELGNLLVRARCKRNQPSQYMRVHRSPHSRVGLSNLLERVVSVLRRRLLTFLWRYTCLLSVGHVRSNAKYERNTTPEGSMPLAERLQGQIDWKER